MKIHLQCLFAFLIFTAGSAFSQTTISSIISSNQTWTAAGSPYILSANAVIQSGAKVTIEPGVEVKSTARNLQIIVQGEVEAIGKKDSAIILREFFFDLTESCKDYDSSTKTGCQFQYCLFQGNGSGGTYALKVNSTTLFIKNCKFIDGYYNIYVRSSASDTNDLYIYNSIFEGKNTNYGYAFYASGGYRLKLHMEDCYVNHLYGMYLPQWASIKRCLFNDILSGTGIRQSTTDYLHLECNKFNKFGNTALDLSSPRSSSTIIIRENTFDSCYAFLRLRVGASYKPATLTIKNNNFLTYTNSSVSLYGSGTPGVADTINFQSNYWGTTSATTISAGISDFMDDITVAGYVDFSNALSGKVSTCSDGSTIGGADTSAIDGNLFVQTTTTNQLNVFPNPATEFINVRSELPITSVSLRDMSGRLVTNVLVENKMSVEVDLSSVLSGLYIIEVADNQQITRKKIYVNK